MSVTAIFQVLVIQYKILSYSEFCNLDEWEIGLMADGLKYADRNEWERTRFQSYITAQCNSTKKMKPTDIIKFPWEKSEQKTTKEQFEEYKKRMNIK